MRYQAALHSDLEGRSYSGGSIPSQAQGFIGYRGVPEPRFQGRRERAGMAQETAQLAEYAAGLRYGDIPADVVQRAKDTIADTIAAIAFGAHLPWSRMIVDYARKRGAGGKKPRVRPGRRAPAGRRWRRLPTARWRTPSRWTT